MPSGLPARRARTALRATTVAAALALPLTGPPTPAAAAPSAPPGTCANTAFARAAEAHDVPRDLLVAVPDWGWAYYLSLVQGDDAGATGTPFPTWGSDVSIRQQPTTGSARVASLPGPTTVRVACQVHGGLVEYDGYSNDAWSYLLDRGGYVSNIFIDVDDAWLPGVPTC
ncbi:hypothetical protein AB0P07_24760 [Streptomyces sp. NPDC085944]|uniref:hypothetical protein n=1 Tax=Streptomyces sp. NPDC085944 TaxID=3154962 RepID=UPI00342B7607